MPIELLVSGVVSWSMKLFSVCRSILARLGLQEIAFPATRLVQHVYVLVCVGLLVCLFEFHNESVFFLDLHLYFEALILHKSVIHVTKQPTSD